MFRVSVFSLVVLASSGVAHAQSCADNFQVEGTPMLTAMNYRTHRIFPGVGPQAALDQLARAVAAEGFSGIRTDKKLGTVTALQETSGSGRPQTLRVAARKSGKGSRVDAVFMVQIGQVSPTGPTQSALCRIVDAVGE